MSRPLPKKFERFAAHLAKANPVAFSDAAAALDALRRCYTPVRNKADIVASGTGGFEFRKDEDGDVTLWILPTIVWGVSDD